MMTTKDPMLEIFTAAAIEAGAVIMTVFRAGPEVRLKCDQSPVTIADEKAEAVIADILGKTYPDIPMVAEEACAAGHMPATASGRFFLVDPLDGTKEFINKSEDFTVNIALIVEGRPVAGVVYAPAKGVLYRGDASGAEKLVIGESGRLVSRQQIGVRACPETLVAVASRSHNSPETLAFLEKEGVKNYRSVGSSLKFCLVAEGEADVYPRFGRTMEWDTAAGDAVVRAAGGSTVGPDGLPLIYGKRNQAADSDFANADFICWGRK
jgi:3'(2'), 5'-bisphosphate nucleotidase